MGGRGCLELMGRKNHLSFSRSENRTFKFAAQSLCRLHKPGSVEVQYTVTWEGFCSQQQYPDLQFYHRTCIEGLKKKESLRKSVPRYRIEPGTSRTQNTSRLAQCGPYRYQDSHCCDLVLPTAASVLELKNLHYAMHSPESRTTNQSRKIKVLSRVEKFPAWPTF